MTTRGSIRQTYCEHNLVEDIATARKAQLLAEDKEYISLEIDYRHYFVIRRRAPSRSPTNSDGVPAAPPLEHLIVVFPVVDGRFRTKRAVCPL